MPAKPGSNVKLPELHSAAPQELKHTGDASSSQQSAVVSADKCFCDPTTSERQPAENPTSQIPPQKPLESMKDMKYDWIWTELWSEWKLLWAPLSNQAKLLSPYYFSTKKKLLLPWIKLMFGRESSEKDGTDVSRTIPCKEMAATVCNRIVEIITRGWNFMWSKTIVQMELF